MCKTLVAVAFIVLLFVNIAQASVVYRLTNQQYDDESTARGATLFLSLTVSDQAVQRGSFSINESTIVPGLNYATGDLSDFDAVSWSVGPEDSGYLTPTSGFAANLSTSLTFRDGIPTGTLSLHGETSEFILSGVSGVFSGTLASDFNNCNDSHGNSFCGVTGQLAMVSSVPEPATIAVLGLGLAATWVIRRGALI